MTTTTQADKDKAAAEAAAKAAAADAAAARIAELEAENAALREQNASQAAKIADPALPEGYSYVANVDGTPIQGVPFAPKSWLTEHKHLLPEGAQGVSKRAVAAAPATG